MVTGMGQDIRHRVSIAILRAGAAILAAFGLVVLCGVQVLAEPTAGDAALIAPDLQQISKAPDRWPETISVVATVTVDLSMNGRKVGQATVLPSQKLKVVGIENGKLLVAVGSIVTSLSPEQTNFWQSYDVRQQEIAAEKSSLPVASATASPPAASASPCATVRDSRATPMGAFSAQAVPLTRRTAEKNGGGLLSSVAGRYYQPLSSPPASLKSEPVCTTLTYFEISVAGRQVPMVVDFGDASRSKVFFDPKGTGELKDAKPQSAQNSRDSRGAPQGYGQYEIGPLAMEISVGKNGAPFKLLVTKYPSGSSSRTPQGYVRVVPVEHFNGSATLAGRKMDVALVDADFDGKLAPGFRAEYAQGVQRSSSTSTPPFDCLALDWNGNQQFDSRNEVLPLVPLLGLGGKHYELTPAENASSLAIREVQPEVGALEKNSSDVDLVLVSDRCAVVLESGENGDWKAPAGEYSTSYFRLHSKKGGVDWSLHGSKAGPGLEKVFVQPGQTTSLKVGAPLTPKFEVSWRGDTALIGFSLAGVGGETYEAGGQLGGNRQPPPDLKIINREGKVLERGTFEYG